MWSGHSLDRRGALEGPSFAVRFPRLFPRQTAESRFGYPIMVHGMGRHESLTKSKGLGSLKSTDKDDTLPNSFTR